MNNLPPLERMAGGEVSDELASVLHGITQITEPDGPKYSSAVSRRLVRWIVCRSYSGPLRELCHLIVASDRVIGATARAEGYEAVFWGTGVARAAAFRAIFHSNLGGAGVEPLGAGIRVTYTDGVFGIAYTRMPFLSALMEFLVSVFGYADLDAKFRALPAGQVTKGDVEALANDLARQVYQYLAAHLPSAQSQRKYRALLSFLRQSADSDQTVGPHSIDDDAVLAFWVFASAEAQRAKTGMADFKSFKSVVRLMVAARDALAAAQQVSALEFALPIGSDRMAGEIDPGEIRPEAVDAALSSIHERRAPMEELKTAPASSLKFLKQREIDAIAPILDFGESALALPLSILRLQVMGSLQARLTEALRRGDDPLGLPHLERPNSVSSAYGDYAGILHQIGDNLQTALLAAFHHLLAGRREEAVSVMLYLRPNMDLSPLAPVFEDQDEPIDAPLDGAEIVRLKEPETEDRFIRTLTAGLDRCPELVAFIEETGKAARRITRKGFKDSDWADNDNAASDTALCGRADACAAASDALVLIRESLLKFTALLTRPNWRGGGLDRQYLSDRDIFSAQFHALYGDR